MHLATVPLRGLAVVVALGAPKFELIIHSSKCVAEQEYDLSRAEFEPIKYTSNT